MNLNASVTFSMRATRNGKKERSMIVSFKNESERQEKLALGYKIPGIMTTKLLGEFYGKAIIVSSILRRAELESLIVKALTVRV